MPKIGGCVLIRLILAKIDYRLFVPVSVTELRGTVGPRRVIENQVCARRFPDRIRRRGSAIGSPGESA